MKQGNGLKGAFFEGSVLRMEHKAGLTFETDRQNDLCIVVSGTDTYPKLYEQMVSTVGTASAVSKDFVCVTWLLATGRPHGYYCKDRFVNVLPAGGQKN